MYRIEGSQLSNTFDFKVFFFSHKRLTLLCNVIKQILSNFSDTGMLLLRILRSQSEKCISAYPGQIKKMTFATYFVMIDQTD